MVFHTRDIFRRNFFIIINSKLSSLMIILGPIILILITGLALQDNSLRSIEASIYSSTSINPSFIEKMNARSFIVINSSSLDDCKSSVLQSKSQVCIEFVPSKSLLSHDSYDLHLYVDFSKQRIVWNIIGSIQGIVDDESTGIRSSLISSLKESIDELLVNLDSNKQKVQDLQSIANRVNNDINFAINNYNDISVKASQVSQSIVLIKSDINSLSSYSVSPTLIKRMGENIDTISSLVSGISDKTGDVSSTSGLVLARDNIQKIISDLERVHSAINSVSGDLRSIRNADLERLSNPIPLSYSSISESEVSTGASTGELGFIDYLFPSFMMFFVLFASIVFSASSTIRERSSNAYVRNVISRASGFDFALGNFITSLLIVSLQTSLILFVAKYFLNSSLLDNFLSVGIVMIVAISLFIMIGMFIGYLFNTNESAIVASISLALIFLIFTPIITPLETLPPVASDIISHTPLVILENKLRLITIFDSSLSFSFSDILSLLGIGALVVILSFFAYHKNREREI